MADKDVFDVKLEHMEKEIGEIKDSVKGINSTLSSHSDTLARIETSLLTQQVTCVQRGKTIDQHNNNIQRNASEIGKLQKADAVQEIKNENMGTTITEMKNFMAKWGPFLSIIAFILFKQIK